MTLLRLLSVRYLRQHPVNLAAAVLATAAGVAMAVVVLVVGASIEASVQDRSGVGTTGLRIVGAATRGGVPDRAVARIRAVPGVARADPVVEAPTVARDPVSGAIHQVMVLGVGCSGPDQPCSTFESASSMSLVRSPAMAEGCPRCVVRTATGQLPTKGAPTGSALVSDDQMTVIVPLEFAQTLFQRHGAVDSVEVEPDPTVSLASLRDDLRSALGPDYVVERSSAPPVALRSVVLAFVPVLVLLALVGVGAGALLVGNAIALSAQERRSQATIVAAIGAAPGTMRRVLLLENGAVGTIGGVAGAAGAMIVARPIVGALSTLTEQSAGVALAVHGSVQAFVVGPVLGLIIGLAAAVGPLRTFRRLDLVAELEGHEMEADSSARSAVGRGLVSAAIVLVAITSCWLAQRGGGLASWQPFGAGLSIVALLMGILGATSAVSTGVLRSAAAPVAKLSAGAQLARSGLLRDGRRTASIVLPVAAAVMTAFITASFTKAVDGNIVRAEAKAPPTVALRVAGSPPGDLGEAGLPRGPEDRAALVAGVDRVERMSVTLVRSSDDIVLLRVADRSWIGAATVAGSNGDDGVADRTAIIGSALARRRGVRVGQFIELPVLAGGTRDVRVSGIVHDGSNGGFNVLVSRSTGQDLVGPLATSEARLVVESGADVNEVARSVRAVIHDPGIHVLGPGQTRSAARQAATGQINAFWTMQRMLLVVAMIAVWSTASLAISQRRRELASLSAIGATSRDLLKMVLFEGVFVVLLGGVVALVGGTVVLAGMALVWPVLAGFVNPFDPDYASLARWLVGVLGLVELALIGPACRTARTDALKALRE